MSDSGPGSALKDARESIGVTEREVADALNLPVKTIEAIEANDREKLPSPVFARGYIRAYAKLLDLDPDPLVAEFRLADTEPVIMQTRVKRPGLNERLTRNQSRLPWIGLVSVLLIGAVAGYFLWSAGSRPVASDRSVEPRAGQGATTGAARLDITQPRAEQAAGNSSESDPDLSGLDDPTAGIADTAAASGAIPQAVAEPLPGDDESTDDQPNVTDAATSGIAQAAQPQSLWSATPGERVRRISAQGDDHLVMKFNKDCWVEVNSTDGQPLFNDLGRTGETLRLIGEAPFRILLGYAPGVTMAFNDEAVPLRPHTRNNVATLVVGQ